MRIGKPLFGAMKFRRKPLIVDAVQWEGFEKRLSDLEITVPDSVKPRDWIIAKPTGEREVLTLTQFAAEYEPVEEKP